VDHLKKKLKKNVKSIDIVLEVLLNPIKQFDLETCRPISLLNLSFELNCVEAYPK
jgi:hypothetical protein